MNAPTLNPKQTRNFWRKVQKTDGCWIWTGAQTKPGGYGQLGIGYKKELAHRISWMIHRGEIPAERPLVLHKCDNPPCCNPDHLFLGTYLDNARDKASKKRSYRPQGEKHHMVKLTNETVLKIRSIYPLGGLSHSNIAKVFCVTKTTIGNILRNKIWKHI